jgi:hypothetical protein
MKSPFIRNSLLLVVIFLIMMVVFPSSGPAPSPDGTLNISGGPAVAPLSSGGLIRNSATGQSPRYPYGEVVFPITGPATPLPATQRTTVTYTPTFQRPTATYTPPFQPTKVTVTGTVQPTTTSTAPTTQRITMTVTQTAEQTPVTPAPTTQQATATKTQTPESTTPASTPVSPSPTVTHTPTFQTATATATPTISPTATVTPNQTATPVTTPTPLYRNGPVYRYMINSGDLTGSLTVTSNPSGAIIALDGYNSETTPWTYTEISSGYHTLEINYPGYEAYIRNIYLNMGESLEIDADLTPLVATGSLFVDSTPQGANVYVDGNSQGLSPVTVNGLSAGPHQIELHLAGYEVLATTEYVIEGQETDVNLILTPYSSSSSYGSIDITSDIPGALVYLDGIYKGITLPGDSFNIIAVDPGPHTLLLHLPGYPDFTETVPVDAGLVSYADAVFSPPTAILQSPPSPSPAVGGVMVTSAPTGGQVYIDNQFRGVTPVTIYNLAAGTHIVNINLAGYNDWSESIDVPADQMIQVPATLIPGGGTTPGPTRVAPSLLTLLGSLAACVIVFAAGNRK